MKYHVYPSVVSIPNHTANKVTSFYNKIFLGDGCIIVIFLERSLKYISFYTSSTFVSVQSLPPLQFLLAKISDDEIGGGFYDNLGLRCKL